MYPHAAQALAAEIAANSPLALAYAKAAMNLASEATLEQGLSYETAAIHATLASEDYRIRLTAFAEKTSPEFPRSRLARYPDTWHTNEKPGKPTQLAVQNDPYKRMVTQGRGVRTGPPPVIRRSGPSPRI